MHLTVCDADTLPGGEAAASPPSQTLTIDVPASEWLTANGRYHWADKARRARALRRRGRMLARAAGLRPSPTGRVQVTAHVHTRTRGRMDPANASPTTKALVDGALVDGRVVPDDDHAHLTGPDHRRGDTRPDLAPGWHAITLTITTI